MRSSEVFEDLLTRFSGGYWWPCYKNDRFISANTIIPFLFYCVRLFSNLHPFQLAEQNM